MLTLMVLHEDVRASIHMGARTTMYDCDGYGLGEAAQSGVVLL